MNFTIISALDLNRGIGYENRLPWHLSSDLKHFKEVTTGNTVIMGRKTWDSIPEKFRPFKERLNIVISRGEVNLPEGVLLAHSLDEALELAKTHGPERKAFVIGGASLYAEAIQHPNCEELILTHIEGEYLVDTYFPEFEDQFEEVDPQRPLELSVEENEEGNIYYRFAVYKRKPEVFLAEFYDEYLDFLKKLCEYKTVFSNPADVEKALEYCKSILEKNLFDYKVYYDKKKNLIAVPKKINKTKPIVYLSAHIDTVDAQEKEWGAPYQPWKLYEDDKELVARGVNDCKAGVAYQLILSHLHAKKKLNLENVIFCISFKEEGAGEKTAVEIGKEMGKTLPVGKETYLLVLENNVQVDPPTLCIYASERSNYVIKLSGSINELKAHLKKLSDWNPVSIKPEEKPSDLEWDEFKQAGGHVCSISREENQLTHQILEASNLTLLRAGEEKNFATVPTRILKATHAVEVVHHLVLNKRSFDSLDIVEKELEGIAYTALKDFDISQGFNIEEKFINSNLKKTLNQCEKTAPLFLKYTYNVGGSDATHIFSTMSKELKSNFYPLVMGPGSRSQKNINPPRVTHGVNETFNKKAGLAAVQFLSSLLEELTFITHEHS